MHLAGKMKRRQAGRQVGGWADVRTGRPLPQLCDEASALFEVPRSLRHPSNLRRHICVAPAQCREGVGAPSCSSSGPPPSARFKISASPLFARMPR